MLPRELMERSSAAAARREARRSEYPPKAFVIQ
jgi:hypothetical protein